MSITGFVNVLKPTGVTSFYVVSQVKKIFNTKKVGHLGTLDPAATGVLPIAVGKATKFFDYFLNKDKVYVARVIFGVETDTLDSFGKIFNKTSKKVKIDDIKAILNEFIGEIDQTPPKFSAVKIDGKRAYELARQDKDFEIKPKKIKIYSINVSGTQKENEFLFEVHCSAGTYIRSLMFDIAKKLGTISTTFAIIRTKSGIFDTKTAVTLEELDKSKKLLKIEDVFKDKKFVDVDEKLFKKFVNGVKITQRELDTLFEEGQSFFIRFKNSLLGMYEIKSGMVCCLAYLFENSEESEVW